MESVGYDLNDPRRPNARVADRTKIVQDGLSLVLRSEEGIGLVIRP